MKIQEEIEELRAFLSLNEPFTKEKVREYYTQKSKNLTDVNLKVKMNRLKSGGVIINVSRGWYRLNDKKTFEPEITSTLKKLSGEVKKGFPFLNFIIWSSNWLNNLTTLQLFRNIIIIEVETGSEEAVFRTIKERFPFKTFLNPGEDVWDKYMHEQEDIIVKTMVSESPNNTLHKIKIARLEKILVDLFCDKRWKTIFSSEIKNIFTDACKNYSVNYSTLLSYAARRGKRMEIWSYIKSLDVLEKSTIEMLEK